MQRRAFLKALPPLAVCGPALFKSGPARALAAAPALSSAKPLELELPQGCPTVTAGAFPSERWGYAGQTHFYQRLWLPGRRREFPDETLAEITEGRLLTAEIAGPDLAIAMANPDDPVSWKAALKQCRLAKAAGAHTLLLAASPYEQYRFHSFRQLEALCVVPDAAKGPDAIISVISDDTYASLANLLFSFTHFDNVLHNVDLADLLPILSGAPRHAFLFDSCGFGPDRAQRAARGVCEGIVERYPMLREQITGAVVFVEAGPTWALQEYFDVNDIFASMLPANANLACALVGRRSYDPWLGVSAIVSI